MIPEVYVLRMVYTNHFDRLTRGAEARLSLDFFSNPAKSGISASTFEKNQSEAQQVPTYFHASVVTEFVFNAIEAVILPRRISIVLAGPGLVMTSTC
jgi:hypothetical protein